MNEKHKFKVYVYQQEQSEMSKYRTWQEVFMQHFEDVDISELVNWLNNRKPKKGNRNGSKA